MNEQEPQDQQQRVSQFKSKSGLGRVLNAFLYSWQGVRFAWYQEHAFRQELMVALPAAVLALFMPVTGMEKLLLIAVLALVLIVELINSAIEAAIDRISLERHPLSKNAKDLGSAAVMLAILVAAATWAVVLFPLI